MESLMEGVDKFSNLPKKFALLFDFSPADMDEEAKEILKTESASKVIHLFEKKISQSGKN